MHLVLPLAFRAWLFIVSVILAGLAVFRVVANLDPMPWDQSGASLCLYSVLGQHPRESPGSRPGVRVQGPVPDGLCEGFRVTTRSSDGPDLFVRLESGRWAYSWKRSDMVVRLSDLDTDGPELLSWTHSKGHRK